MYTFIIDNEQKTLECGVGKDTGTMCILKSRVLIGLAGLGGMELSYMKAEMYLVGLVCAGDDGSKEAERTGARLQVSRPRAQALLLPHIVFKRTPPGPMAQPPQSWILFL